MAAETLVVRNEKANELARSLNAEALRDVPNRELMVKGFQALKHLVRNDVVAVNMLTPQARQLINQGVALTVLRRQGNQRTYQAARIRHLNRNRSSKRLW